MIWDAGINRVDGNVSIDEFLNVIEMVGSKEIDALDDASSLWRLPSGRHLSVKNISMLLGEQGHDDLLRFRETLNETPHLYEKV